MAVEGGSVRVVFEGDTAPLRRSVSEATEEIDKVGEAARRADEAISETLGKSFRTTTLKNFRDFSSRAGDAFAHLVDKTDATVSAVGKLGSSLKNVGLATFTAGVTTAAGSLVNLAKKGIQSADFLESARVAMSGLTGSFEEGNKAMSIAAAYWQNNPFQRIDVTNATKQLVQFGRTTKDIASDLDILGNVSLSTGMGIDELARYYARVSSSGRAMTLDIEMMADRGVPIYRELQKQLHTTTDGVREMASQGKIDFETFRKAMEGAVDADAMAEYENTLARQTDRLKGSIGILAGALAGYKTVNNELVISEQGLEKAWTRLLKTVATGLRSDDMKAAMEKLGYAIAKVVDKITELAGPALTALGKAISFIADNSQILIPILGVAAVFIGKIAGRIPILSQVVAALGKQFGGIGEALRKITAINPALLVFVGLLGAGFTSAMKNSEEFRATISSIAKSLGTIIDNLSKAFQGIFNVIGEIVDSLAGSGAVQYILQGVASALAWIAQAIASIPPEAIASIISFFVSLKLLKANPIYLIAAGLALLVSRIKELGGIGEILKNLPEQLATIGHNMMTGLINGIQEGAQKVFAYIKQIGSVMVSSLKNVLGIHSPSTVMYGIGENVVLGLANGIEDNKSAVQIAMNNLAKDILSLSEKVIKNKVDFGIVDVKGEYQQWKKVAKMFAVGSEQYNAAIEKMEEARKQANLQIISLQKTYNDALDATIDRIANMYGLLDDVNLKAGKNATQILKGLDQQVAKLQEWAEAQEMISKSGLDAGLVEELQSMGVDATSELSAIANMTADELSTLNNMWLKKQEIANKAGVKQMEGLKNDTLDQINDLKKGIDGATVDVEDVGGRLVSKISEGVYGAMPTLESAFSQLGDYIEKAQRELAKSASGSSSGSDLGASTDVPNAGEEVVNSLKDEIQNGIGKLKNMLPQILLGGIAAWGTLKFGPKILTAIGKKLVGGSKLSTQALGGILEEVAEGTFNKEKLSHALGTIDIKNQDGFLSKAIRKLQGKLAGESSELAEEVGETAKNMKKTTKPAETIAQSSTSVGQSMNTASKGLSKANSLMSTIIKGALAVVAIAGAIAAMAGALWLAYNLLKDIDFQRLAEVMGEIVLAVVAMGALAKLGDMLNVGLKGILVIAGIAADIAVVALACRAAYELMKDVPFVDFAAIVGEMAIAVVAFGALAALGGLIAEVAVIGLLLIVGIAAEIALVAIACRTAYEIMKPVRFDKFAEIIGEMALAIGAFALLDVVIAIAGIFAGFAWFSIIAICDEIVRMAAALKYVYDNVPDDITGVNKKIDLIKDVLNKLKDVDLGSLIGSMVASWEIGNLVNVVDNYVHIAEQLNKLQDITLDQRNIETNLDIVRSAMEKVKAKTDVISAVLQSWADEANANSVESAGKVITVYGDIIDTLEKLSDVKIDGSVENGVTKMTEFVQKVLDTVSSITTNWWVDVNAIENTVGKAQSMINKFSEMIPVIQEQIQDKGLDVNKATAVIDNIKTILEKIGEIQADKNISDKEESVGKAQSIINKFTEIVPTVGQLVSQDFNFNDAKGRVVAVRDIVYEIGLINQDFSANNLQKKADILDKAQSLINKMTQLAPTISQLTNSGIDKTKAVEKVQAVQNIVWEIGNGVNITHGTSNLEQKAQILDKTQSLINKMTELAPTIKQLTKVGVESESAISSVQTIQNLVWEIGQINTGDSGNLSTKEWVVGMAASIAYKLGEFSHAVSTIGKVNGEVAKSAIDAMNTMFSGIANNLSGSVVVFENVGADIGRHIASGVRSQTPEAQQAGFQIQSGLWSAIESKMNDEYQQGAWMATQFGNGLKSVSFANVGQAMQSSLWWGIQNRMNDEYQQGRTMGKSFRQGLYDVDYGNAGWWAVQGFINGVWGKAGSGDGVYHTGWWIADRFLRGLKDRGGQGSPWKTTLQSGNWAVEGLINGLREQEGALVTEANTLADEVIDALTMDDLTLSPELDANVSGRLAPNVTTDEYGIVGGRNKEVTINQQIEAYTPVDMDAISRNLAWDLAKV